MLPSLYFAHASCHHSDDVPGGQDHGEDVLSPANLLRRADIHQSVPWGMAILKLLRRTVYHSLMLFFTALHCYSHTHTHTHTHTHIRAERTPNSPCLYQWISCDVHPQLLHDDGPRRLVMLHSPGLHLTRHLPHETVQRVS